ncbi:hypothetical protein EYF80_047885 [Liparis tanakae]|uniref:Uncharacterized protein n=1 Tax=Liparis tanakae TaxID=230148 RepID=A0A4Z2FLB2_9TELE|nr:hypothetical protein EYF80_047885 [Liparis tanakae]
MSALLGEQQLRLIGRTHLGFRIAGNQTRCARNHGRGTAKIHPEQLVNSHAGGNRRRAPKTGGAPRCPEDNTFASTERRKRREGDGSRKKDGNQENVK